MVSGALDTTLLVIVALIAAVALAAAITAIVVQRRIRRTLRVTRGLSGNEVLVTLRNHADDLDVLDAAVVDARSRLTRIERGLDVCTSRVAMAQYDAFPDMGGKLSFSVAMLDEQGDGIVLSVINGRSETRAWGKRVVGGTSRQRLSDEEAEVLQRALTLDRRRADEATAGDAR